MTDVARGSRYVAARAITGLSQRQLAKRLGVSPQAISKWESGQGEASRANARKLCDMAHISLEWLLTGKERGEAPETVTNVQEFLSRGRKVPEVGDTVAGIAPMGRNKAARKFVQTYFPCSSESFALVVSDDSMDPDFREGDVVVIDPELDPRPGDFVFVEMGDGRRLFRRYRPRTASSYALVPCNEDWPHVTVTTEDKAVIKGVMSEKASPRRRG